jgi:hypothetical protein
MQYMPILFQSLIDRLGYKWTLRISALITAAVAVSPGSAYGPSSEPEPDHNR